MSNGKYGYSDEDVRRYADYHFISFGEAEAWLNLREGIGHDGPREDSPGRADVLPGGTVGAAEEQSVPGGTDLHVMGAKDDSKKPDASLLQFFGPALLEVALVGTFGQDKYTRGGWLEVPNGHARYTAAMLRHFFAESIEGTYDQDPSCEEYGYKDKIRHEAQVAWNALARLTLTLKEEQDDK